MTAQPRSLSILLVCALATLTAPVASGQAHAAPAASDQTMPDGLMAATMAVLGQPLTAGHVAIQVNDRGAAYSITIDPLVYLQQKVITSGETNNNFGFSVALSDDGNTVLVGAGGANRAQGSAYLFARSRTT